MEFYFLAIGVYGKSGMSEWLWKWTKLSNSVIDYSLSESKVLGLSLTCYRWYLNIGTTSITIESVPHPLQNETRKSAIIITEMVWSKDYCPKSEKEIGYVIKKKSNRFYHWKV